MEEAIAAGMVLGIHGITREPDEAEETPHRHAFSAAVFPRSGHAPRLTRSSMIVGRVKHLRRVRPASGSGRMPSVRPRRTDLRRADRLRHAEEDRDALSTAACRQGFVDHAEAAVDVLPVVHDPDVTGR